MLKGIKILLTTRILLTIPEIFTLIVGYLTYLGKGILSKKERPYSTELYVCVFYAVMIAI